MSGSRCDDKKHAVFLFNENGMRISLIAFIVVKKIKTRFERSAGCCRRSKIANFSNGMVSFVSERVKNEIRAAKGVFKLVHKFS